MGAQRFPRKLARGPGAALVAPPMFRDRKKCPGRIIASSRGTRRQRRQWCESLATEVSSIPGVERTAKAPEAPVETELHHMDAVINLEGIEVVYESLSAGAGPRKNERVEQVGRRAEVHEVVVELGRPVTGQRIFYARDEHPPPPRIVDARRLDDVASAERKVQSQQV